MKNFLIRASVFATNNAAVIGKRVRHIVRDTSGEGFVDTAVKILISVVVGALILSALYALFGETILPPLRDRIVDMFNYGN